MMLFVFYGFQVPIYLLRMKVELILFLLSLSFSTYLFLFMGMNRSDGFESVFYGAKMPLVGSQGRRIPARVFSPMIMIASQ